MNVELLADDQYGPDGPQSGQIGYAYKFVDDEGETWFGVRFMGFPDVTHWANGNLIRSVER